MDIFVGIDSSSESQSIAIVDSDGKRHDSFAVTNDLLGFECLDRKIGCIKGVRVGLELTFGPLIDFLRMKNYEIYFINPLKIKRFKECRTVAGDKTDERDALALAEFLRENIRQLRPALFSSSEVEQIKLLGILYDRRLKQKTRLTNELIFVLKQYFPLYVDMFTSTNSKILMNFIIEFPRWGMLQQAKAEHVQEFLRMHHYRNPKQINAVLEKIKSYRQSIDVGNEEVLSLEAISLAEEILLIKNTLKEIERRMAIITKKHPHGNVFKSIPGVGGVLSAKLMGIMGDNLKRFDSADGVKALMGTAPRNYQSGSYHKVLFRRACQKRGRNILWQVAFSSLQHCTWAKAYYTRQREKGKRHAVALRALSNKWTSIIYKLWKDVQCYDAGKILKVA